MKLLVQKLPLSERTSFVARTYRTPEFEVPWHQHVEYELILFTEGCGLGFIGNHVGRFESGDIYFLGPNLPHTFQKLESNLLTSAIVVQFREDLLGNNFVLLPECYQIMKLFKKSMQGLKIEGNCRTLLQPLIKELETLRGFQRIIRLCECLNLIEKRDEFKCLSTQTIVPLNYKDQKRIDEIFQFTIDSFKEPISLSDVAKVVCLSVPAFCNYFKKSTKKTYVYFLNEIRIDYACRSLIDTELTILNICYKSGYNTLANFNKQFLKIKKMTPSQYRKHYKELE
jgi:AraC-like DNA-binding protein